MINIDVNKIVGSYIKKRRLNLGCSQENLAGRVSLSRPSITNIEAGRQGISIEQLFQFASALETTPQYLIGDLRIAEPPVRGDQKNG